MKYDARVGRLLRSLTPLDRARLLESTDDDALTHALWNSMPPGDAAEVNAHGDFARRLLFVLAPQGELLRQQLLRLYSELATINAFAMWGGERYLRDPSGARTTMAGPSHPLVLFGTPDARLDAALNNPFDALVRGRVEELRAGIVSADASLRACQDTANALKAAGPFGDFIDQLLQGKFEQLREALEDVVAGATEYTGELPAGRADPELLSWFRETFSAELRGEWPAPSAPPPPRRMVISGVDSEGNFLWSHDPADPRSPEYQNKAKGLGDTAGGPQDP